MRPLTLNLFGTFIQHYQEAFRATRPMLKDSYTSGMEIGDFLNAGYSITASTNIAFLAGVDLDTLASELAVYSAALAQVKQDSAQVHVGITWQTVQHLRETVSQPDCLIGTAYDERVMLPKQQQNNDLMPIAIVYIYKLLLAYSWGNYQAAFDYITTVKSYLMAVSGLVFIPVFHFYAALTHLALFPTGTEIEQGEILAQVETHQIILHQWAKNAPMNHLHKWYLVEAEKHRVLGKKAVASECYDQAINLAKEHQFINEEALANELAAKFYLDWSKERIAREYMTNAYYGYAHWGAKAKVADLEKRYPQLLAPILQQTRSPLSTTETLFTLGTVTSTSSATSSSSSVSVALDLAAILKAFQTISCEIELSKLLSSLLRIVIENAGADKCVLMLLQDERLVIKGSMIEGSKPVVLQNLLVEDSQDIPLKLIYKVKNNKQTVVLLDGRTEPNLANDPYIMSQQPYSILCSPILHQGKLMGILYLENKLSTGAFTSDRVELLNLICAQAAISLENAQLYNHLQEREKFLSSIYEGVGCLIFVTDIRDNGRYEYTGWSKSCEIVIGIPASQVIGKSPQELMAPDEVAAIEQKYLHCFQTGIPITYEECLTFNDQKIWFLTTLSPLKDETGKVYRVVGTTINISDRKQAESAVTEKSQALKTALEDLQQAQLQIVQSEKMSALGNLVAGVAHEMNNPLGFIAASLKQAKPTFTDIVDHLKLYQATLPDKSEEIEDHESEIDLEYSLEDLPKMLDSMTMACDRLKNISTSLRTFSRADRDYKVPFNIHEGIDSTILILKHRLKANDQRPAIEVITNYGNLPEVECFPGQLNQVFMNIIANAIDAIEESNNQRSFAEIKANPNQIIIETDRADNQVKIRIADNGIGMNEEIEQKIFDHLFTTKGVGKGTGLGLAIAKSIVESTHSGKLSCNSVLGEGTEFLIEIPA